LQLSTVDGTRFSQANLVLTLDVSPPVGDSAAVTVDFFSILSESTIVSGHNTGPMSFWMDGEANGMMYIPTGAISLPIHLRGSYDYIDSLFPPTQDTGSNADQFVPQVEELDGSVDGTFDFTPGSEHLTATVDCNTTTSRSGLLNSIRGN